MFQTFVDVSPRKCVVPNLLQQIVGNPCALPDWSKMKVFQPPTRGHWERLQTFFHTVMRIYLGSLILDSLGYVWAINLDVMHRRRLSWLLGIHGLSRVKWIINATGKVGEKWKPSHFMGIFAGENSSSQLLRLFKLRILSSRFYVHCESLLFLREALHWFLLELHSLLGKDHCRWPEAWSKDLVGYGWLGISNRKFSYLLAWSVLPGIARHS